jgi:hypothetical protein
MLAHVASNAQRLPRRWGERAHYGGKPARNGRCAGYRREVDNDTSAPETRPGVPAGKLQPGQRFVHQVAPGMVEHQLTAVTVTPDDNGYVRVTTTDPERPEISYRNSRHLRLVVQHPTGELSSADTDAGEPVQPRQDASAAPLAG